MPQEHATLGLTVDSTSDKAPPMITKISEGAVAKFNKLHPEKAWRRGGVVVDGTTVPHELQPRPLVSFLICLFSETKCGHLVVRGWD